MEQNIHWYWNSVSVTAPENRIWYPSSTNLLSTVLTFTSSTTWFQVLQPPHSSSPLMAAAEPVKPADKSEKKRSSSKVSQFGILISAPICSDGPWKSYFITTTAQQFPSAQWNFQSIDSLVSGLTVASFLLPSCGCCRPCEANRKVCKETQQLTGEQIWYWNYCVCDSPWKSSFIPQLNKSPEHSLFNFHIINSLVSGVSASSLLFPSYGWCRACQASRQVCKEKQQLKGEPIWYFNLCISMQ